MMFKTSLLTVANVNPSFCKMRGKPCAGTLTEKELFCPNRMNFRKASRTVEAINPDYLYIVVSGLHGDEANQNGDYFDWSGELLRKRPHDGLYVYETWKGKPALENHDETLKVGEIADAYPILAQKSIDMLMKVSRRDKPLLCKRLEQGKVTDVSMGCAVGWSLCSACDNKAFTESEWCDHIKFAKGKTDHKTGKAIYEKNFDCTGIECSFITFGEGADPKAKQKAILAKRQSVLNEKLVDLYCG